MPRDGQGNPVASFGRGRLNDDMHKQRGAKPPVKEKAAEPAGEPDGQQDVAGMAENESPENIQDVVAEHGPAHTVHHFHDHEGGHHHVVSYHGQHAPEKEHGAGFTHHSHHASVHEAHKHAGHALGIQSAEHEAKESPEFEAGEQEGKREAIPGLA